MTRGRKPKPAGLRKGVARPDAPGALPRCPPHLSDAAEREWRRLATPLHTLGVLTVADRAALAAYCQAWGRWIEAEEKLTETPTLLKTPSGYVQQSPWLSIANKQLEIMGRYMGELGLTPSSRQRVGIAAEPDQAREPVEISFVTVYPDGTRVPTPRALGGRKQDDEVPATDERRRIELLDGI